MLGFIGAIYNFIIFLFRVITAIFVMLYTGLSF